MMKKAIRHIGLIAVIIFLLTIFTQPVLAAIVWSGDIDPANPATWTSTTDGYIGKTLDGTLDINDGDAVTDSRGYIGSNPGATGTVTVDGIGSMWTNSGFVYVGNYGDGTLNITDGGTVSNTIAFVAYRPDSISDVTVDGSTWTNTGGIYIGRDGNGTLDVKAGGTASSNGESSIGYSLGATGSVTVDGIDSGWTNTSSLNIGYYGNGTLDVTGGGVVSSNDAYVGRYADSISDVTIDGIGSMLNINGRNGTLSIGLLGEGTMEISDGGTVSNNYGYVGSNLDSTGKVTIDGPGSMWTNNKYLRVGYYGNGTLNITGGSKVISEWDGGIGYELGSTGAVAVDGPGSTWANNDALYVGRYGSGRLTITNGGLVSVDLALNIDTDGDGDGFIYIASGGQLAKKGNAGGTLTGFLGLLTGTDAIRYWNVSNWADITCATYGVDYSLTYLTEGELAGYTVLTVFVPGPPDPDIDRDGDVDMQDFAELALHWLDTGCTEHDWCGLADIDYSGDVGFSDLQILTEHWLEGAE